MVPCTRPPADPCRRRLPALHMPLSHQAFSNPVADGVQAPLGPCTCRCPTSARLSWQSRTMTHPPLRWPPLAAGRATAGPPSSQPSSQRTSCSPRHARGGITAAGCLRELGWAARLVLPCLALDPGLWAPCSRPRMRAWHNWCMARPRLQDPVYWQTVHLGGDELAQHLEALARAAKEQWQAALRVEDPVMRTHAAPGRTVTQVTCRGVHRVPGDARLGIPSQWHPVTPAADPS